MKKIDIHTHFIPRDWPRFKDRFGYGGFIHFGEVDSCSAQLVWDDGTPFRKIQPNCWDIAVRQKECEKENVQVQVLSPLPIMFHYWAKPDNALSTCQFLNDSLLGACLTNPDRFVGLAVLPLQDPKRSVQELKRVFQNSSSPSKSSAIVGIEIGTHVEDLNLSDAAFFPVYEAAEDLGVPIFVHPWDMMGANRMKKYWLPWLVGMPAETSLAICSMIFGGVFDRFPRLRVAFAHGGGSFPGTLGRIEHGYQVRPDLCAIDCKHSPREYLGNFYVDSLVHDSNQLTQIIQIFGEDKVCLGSDYPFPLGEKNPGHSILESALDESVKQKLLFDNACAWLGWNKEKFL